MAMTEVRDLYTEQSAICIKVGLVKSILINMAAKVEKEIVIHWHSVPCFVLIKVLHEVQSSAENFEYFFSV